MDEGGLIHMRNRNMKLITGAALCLALTVLFAGFVRALPANPDSSGYHIVKKITTGGTEGWDYISMDSDARLAYIGREDHIDVVNVDSGTVVGKVPGLMGTSGMLPLPEFGRGYAMNGDAGSVVIVDLKTLAKIGTVKAGKDPDSFTYEPVTKRVFVMNSSSANATAINAKEGTVAGTVALGGQPEAAVSDGKGKVYVNLTDKDQIAEVDAETMKVTHRWPLAPGTGPSGLAIDRKNRRLFSACDNQKMVVMNADTGKVVATLRTGAGTDGAGFDPETGNAFASAGGAGTLTIIHEDSPESFKVLEELDTQSGARTMTVDAKTHNVLTITARHGHGATHDKVLPDSFVVLVVGK
jgi:DNA-binding beta-propeller fold protein YncE